MNRGIKPYNFTKDIRENFDVFYKKVIDCNGVVCFDFEDSVSSFDNNTNAYKNSHRKNIIQQLKDNYFEIDLNKIGVRINGVGSENYNYDIENIGDLDALNSLFLPKVESSKQIEILLKDLPKGVNEIIPIIETEKGFENIEEILSIKDIRYLRVAFGHCDYNMSKEYFPFYHQNTRKFWQWVTILEYYSELAGKELINSPILNLDDDDLFVQTLLNNKSFKNITGQITLCLKQTLMCGRKENVLDKSFNLIEEKRNNKFEIASEIIDRFERNKLIDRFFAIDEKRIIISPQEYKMAKYILSKN
jgi:citrate lyase beta subunit